MPILPHESSQSQPIGSVKVCKHLQFSFGAPPKRTPNSQTQNMIRATGLGDHRAMPACGARRSDLGLHGEKSHTDKAAAAKVWIGFSSQSFI